jgi:2-polyprenyl-3-methyl-5-hydroxy-6-metoxy-1,4-benzoquinol methylase
MRKPPSDKEIHEVYFSNVRTEMLHFIPGNCKIILEVGCSGGLFGESLKKNRKATVWGVEPNVEAATLAATRLDKVITGEFPAVLPDFPAGFFDCIVFNDVLEHLTDPEKALDGCKRILSEQGYIVSSIPNVRYIGNLAELLFRKDWEYKAGGILDRTHYRFYTQKSIIRMFTHSGFRVIKCEGINPTHSWKTRILGPLTFSHFSDVKFLEFATVVQVQ